MAKIAIIGGGVAGATTSLYLSQIGMNVTLFEQNENLISGPPFCHLHSGGNLYREIPDSQCITLLKESIDLVRFYPHSIDYRPTVIAIPQTDNGNPNDLIPRLEVLKNEYQKLIEIDPNNCVLGKSNDYYKVYDEESINTLKTKSLSQTPQTMDEWMIPVAKNLDMSKIKFPLIIVQEYGLNLFRLSASVLLSLKNISNCTIRTNTKVININKINDTFDITSQSNSKTNISSYDYIINAAGYKSGYIDDMLGFKRDRFVEFKAAYVTKWNESNDNWPEIIFHGTRGTPEGMGQFTPYLNGHFQLHGMTEDITLFKNGLVQNSSSSSQPLLNKRFIDKIETGWSKQVLEERTSLAIKHLAQYIPSFATAKVASKPLYGAQQIPGNDKELRAAEVSFEGKRYARCEVVKASSVLTMIDAIVKQLIELEYIDKQFYKKRNLSTIKFDENLITSSAQSICQQMKYPQSLGGIQVASNTKNGNIQD